MLKEHESHREPFIDPFDYVINNLEYLGLVPDVMPHILVKKNIFIFHVTFYFLFILCLCAFFTARNGAFCELDGFKVTKTFTQSVSFFASLLYFSN